MSNDIIPIVNRELYSKDRDRKPTGHIWHRVRSELPNTNSPANPVTIRNGHKRTKNAMSVTMRLNRKMMDGCW